MSETGFRYVLEPTDGFELLNMKRFVTWLVERDSRFNNSGRGIRCGARVLAEFDANKACYRLHPDDWKLLADVSEKPDCGYPKLLVKTTSGATAEENLGRRLVPFLDAIANAATEAPKDG